MQLKSIWWAGKPILNVDRLFATKSMPDCLGWKTLDSRRDTHLNIMVYKCVTARALLYLRNYFRKVSDNTSYKTRGSTQVICFPKNLGMAQAREISGTEERGHGINFLPHIRIKFP